MRVEKRPTLQECQYDSMVKTGQTLARSAPLKRMTPGTRLLRPRGALNTRFPFPRSLCHPVNQLAGNPDRFKSCRLFSCILSVKCEPCKHSNASRIKRISESAALTAEESLPLFWLSQRLPTCRGLSRWRQTRCICRPCQLSTFRTRVRLGICAFLIRLPQERLIKLEGKREFYNFFGSATKRPRPKWARLPRAKGTGTGVSKCRRKP